MVYTNHTGSVCNACGGMFDAPLLALIFSNSPAEEYYACPKCLSKVRSVERQEQPEVEDTVAEAASCAHHLGYLKRRPKNISIPEECLTCTKMIECMY